MNFNKVLAHAFVAGTTGAGLTFLLLLEVSLFIEWRMTPT